VWLITRAVFAAAAQNLIKRWQCRLAISAIIAVPIGMHFVVAALDI